MLESLSLPFVQRGMLEIALLAVAAGLIGTWVVLRGLAFYAHAVGTATFPGLVLASGLGFAAPLGAFGAAVGFALAMAVVAGRRRAGTDSLTALVLVGALALGVILANDVFASGGDVETAAVRLAAADRSAGRRPRRPARARSRWAPRGSSGRAGSRPASSRAPRARRGCAPAVSTSACCCWSPWRRSRASQPSARCSRPRCSWFRRRPRGCGRGPFTGGGPPRSRWSRPRDWPDCGCP